MCVLLDISDGSEVKITGTPLDIDRVMQACREALRRVETEHVGLPTKMTITVKERDKT